MQVRRNAWKLVIGLALAAAVVLVTVRGTIRAEQWAQSRANNAIQGGVRYRDVQFGPTTYRLPAEKYLIGITPYNKERNYAAFTFDAIAPEVVPASSDLQEVSKWGKGKGWLRQLRGLVEYGSNFITQQERVEHHFNYSQRFKVQVESDTEERQKLLTHLKFLDRNVYTTLANGCRKYEGKILTGNVIQVCGSGDDDHMLVVECDPGDTRFLTPSPSCTVAINLADKTRITYHYSYDYFDQALAIHGKVVALINSFRIDAKPRIQP